MPGLRLYPYDDPASLERLANDEQQARTKQIDAAWDYYEGRHKKPLKVRAGQVDDNVILNVSRKVIEQAVSLLFGKTPGLEIGDKGDQPEDVRLAEIWEANHQDILLHNMALQGALTGHVFVKLQPEVAPASQGVSGVRFVLLNPRMVSVFWRPDDMGQVTAYTISYTDGDADFRQDMIDEGDVWLVRDLRKERGRGWEVVNEVVWGWPWAPMVEWQNLPDPEEYYGDPDLVRPELNDAINFLASNTNRIIKFHAHPKTVGIGMRASDLQETTVDGFWSVPNPAATINNLEMQSDLSSSMGYLQMLEGWFFSEHRAVDMTSFAKDLGNITNFGLHTLYKDAMDKLETKRSLYGAALADMSERALALVGMTARPVVSWPDPLPFNDQEEIAGIQTEIGLGILSRETAASLRGRDWEQEQERIEQEAAAEDNIGARLMRAFDQGL
jgi:hypothetical protein